MAQDTARKKKERAQVLSASGGLTQAEWEAAESEASVAESRLAQAQAQALASSSAGSDARLANAAYHFASTASPPRSAIGSGTTRTSIPAKWVSVRLTAMELAQARYQPRNACEG